MDNKVVRPSVSEKNVETIKKLSGKFNVDFEAALIIVIENHKEMAKKLKISLPA